MHIRMSRICLGGFPVRGPAAAGRPSSTTLSQAVPANASLTRSFGWMAGKNADPAALDLVRRTGAP